MMSLQDLSPEEIARAAVDNLAAHISYVQGQTPGMMVLDNPDLLLTDCGLPCDTFNLICRARLDSATASASIRAAIEHFAANERPFSWWVSPGDSPPELAKLLLGAGLRADESETAMVANLDGLELNVALPAGLQIRRARTEAELRDFSTVMAANWTPPDPHVVRYYELAAPVLLREDSPLQYYIGYVGETAVATAELTIGGGVTGLYNICTLENYRRRGFGAALTQWALHAARDQGQRTAVLQASTQGAGIYERIGFRPFGLITEYKPTF